MRYSQPHTEASGMTERLPCGHYSDRGDFCFYCEGTTPDPWDLVTGDEYRDLESRSYRQTKTRKAP